MAESQLKRIDRLLDSANVPKEVWIGTDSTADRVEWLTIRNNLNQQNSRSRHKIIETMSEVLEAALQTTCLSAELRERARESLALAGRRQSHDYHQPTN